LGGSHPLNHTADLKNISQIKQLPEKNLNRAFFAGLDASSDFSMANFEAPQQIEPLPG
jgi:hypothetical protein